jgi:CRISPR system Cascade subunit CasC
VSVCRDTAPRNLANAFETAIRVKSGESLTQKSAQALVIKANALDKAYPRKGETFVLDLTQADIGDFGRKMESLAALLDAVLPTVEG